MKWTLKIHWLPRRLPRHLICELVFASHLGMAETLTCTVVEGIEHGKKGANDKNISILVERHLVR
jgi:hypothetical protein